MILNFDFLQKSKNTLKNVGLSPPDYSSFNHLSRFQETCFLHAGLPSAEHLIENSMDQGSGVGLFSCLVEVKVSVLVESCGVGRFVAFVVV